MFHAEAEEMSGWSWLRVEEGVPELRKGAWGGVDALRTDRRPIRS